MVGNKVFEAKQYHFEAQEFLVRETRRGLNMKESEKIRLIADAISNPLTGDYYIKQKRRVESLIVLKGKVRRLGSISEAALLQHPDAYREYCKIVWGNFLRK